MSTGGINPPPVGPLDQVEDNRSQAERGEVIPKREPDRKPSLRQPDRRDREGLGDQNTNPSK